MEQTLLRLLEYQTEKKFDPDGILMALCLFNLAEMIQVLPYYRSEPRKPARGSGGDVAPAVPGDLQGLLAPLMGLMAAGMGQGNPATGQQTSFNPANLLNMLGVLGGGQGKGGSLDLASLLGLLGPLLGLGGQSEAGGAVSNQAETGGEVRPVHREINLDHKIKGTKNGQYTGREREPQEQEKNETKTLPKPGEVLEWKFGT